MADCRPSAVSRPDRDGLATKADCVGSARSAELFSACVAFALGLQQLFRLRVVEMRVTFRQRNRLTQETLESPQGMALRSHGCEPVD
jgi:hypothetical protein